MSVNFYELREPSQWAHPPRTYSFSTLQALQLCTRRWQLINSSWGAHARFPERPQPAAIAGQIVHEALDLLARELGRQGRPPIGSSSFRDALERCGFWTYFALQVNDWNRRLAAHPRTGPPYVLRANPRDLANQAIRLFRERYQSRIAGDMGVSAKSADGLDKSKEAPLMAQLQARGAVSEVRLEHPALPLVGVLDFVSLESNGSATIVDYKTGTRKSSHEEQVLLYALLWWRVTGTRPGKAVVQYLDTTWVSSPEEAMLLQSEKAVEIQIEQAKEQLASRPAAGNPSEECAKCPVRPRCDEGWAKIESAAQASGGRSIDLEVKVASSPTATGFLGVRANGDEVPVVFDVAVGRCLPPMKTGDRFRIVDAKLCSRGQEITLLPWTETYRL